MVDVVNGAAAQRIRLASIMSKSQAKPVPRNGDQNIKNARRRGSLDFCLRTNRDTRSRLFMRVRSADQVHGGSTAAPMIADVFKDVYKGQNV